MIAWTTVESPLGPLVLTASDAGLTTLYMDVAAPAVALRADDHPVLQRTRQQLAGYFAGERSEFDLPLAPRGTSFQQRVWNLLLTVPFGATTSYGTIAIRLGKPAAMRAVGLANGRNPISIIIPCHRVIGANGSLTGYGGGIERKRWLLAHEQAVRARQDGRLL
jgi:methylated-DNA-[protein]-cysteine S-methyltransferase